MRKKIFFIGINVAIFLIACQNDNKEKHEYKMTGEADSTQKLPDSLLKHVSPSFAQLDPRVSTACSSIVNHYLALKNALANDDGSAAANAGAAMSTEIKNFDIVLLNEEQKKLYNSFSDDMKENAEHISESGKDIGHQREHFSMLSDEVLQLVKGFGGGRMLYVENCPMAFEDKGAIWLSEFKEVKNPYFARPMTECVKIEEIVR